ncbi:MAG: GNAT family N-acetyltransferase [Stagnimonas sp.]|nr:GNAT family N-acetyltransferase [Stagnimonas sp.]
MSADAADIARLANELGYAASTAEIASRLQILLPSPTQFVAVAESGGALVGWVAAEQRLLLESGERAELVGLVVGAAARRSGAGSALVAAAEGWASSRKLTMICVRSNVSRPESHPFYERLGYVRRKTQHVYLKPLSC